MVIVEHQDLQLCAQRGWNARQLQGTANGRLLAIGPFAGAVGGTTLRPVIAPHPADEAAEVQNPQQLPPN